MGALCVSSIALRPRTIWNAAGIGTPAGQLEPSGTPGTVLPSKGSQRGLELPAGRNLLSAEREVDAGNR